MTAIERLVEQSGYSEHLRVILLEKPESEPAALLVVKSMPEVALVVWPENQHTTHDQIVFFLGYDNPSRQFTVVCACCGPLDVQLDCPFEKNTPQAKEWYKEKYESFFLHLNSVCMTEGVKTVLMRRANAWPSNIKPEVRVVATENFFDEYCEFYGRKTVEKNMGWLDHNSRF